MVTNFYRSKWSGRWVAGLVCVGTRRMWTIAVFSLFIDLSYMFMYKYSVSQNSGARYIFVHISYANGNIDVLLLFRHSLQCYLFKNITILLYYCHITCLFALQKSILSSNCKVHIWTYGWHIWIYYFDFFIIYQILDINKDISAI